MNKPPLSPPSEPTPPAATTTSTAEPIPLDSPIRTTPIHQLLPEIRIPGGPLPPHKYHPVTCETIDMENDETRSQLERLRRQYTTPEAALKAQEQAVREAKAKITAVERKRAEVQEAIDKKVKERDLELKVLEKYREVKASEVLS